MDKPLTNCLCLGIESSCDETAAAVVSGERKIHSACLLSQSAHSKWGGVVPEVAARAHIESLDRLITQALREAGTTYEQLGLVAVGCGPGLIGGVLVGCGMAKGIAIAADKPLVTVNHLAAHALTARLEHPDCNFPYLVLLASGGHCLFALAEAANKFTELGSTMDDAAGEAFDKIARLLGLGFPGGAELERLAAKGDDGRFPLPRPLIGDGGCDFSFSGLKTAARRLVEQNSPPDGQKKADIAASFQRAIIEVMVERSRNAIQAAGNLTKLQGFVFCGGVAANRALRLALRQTAGEARLKFYAPSADLCTDNAVMIAWSGIELLETGGEPSLAVEAAARLPIGYPTGAPIRPPPVSDGSPV